MIYIYERLSKNFYTLTKITLSMLVNGKELKFIQYI